MSTVDIDKGAENIAKLNKLGYPELDGACPTCGINPVTILAHHTQTLKAELLAKMPTSGITVHTENGTFEDLVSRRDVIKRIEEL